MLNKGLSRKYLYLYCCFIVFFICFLSFSRIAATMPPEEILKKSDQARGNTDGIEWEILLDSTEGNKKQQRTIKVSAYNFNCLAEFLKPANVKGQKMLMIDRNMWFIKPGLSKAVPISPRQKLLGVAANGDISSTNYAGDYKVDKMSEDVINDEPCYLLQLTSINKKTTYDSIKYWISKKRLVGVKAEFYTVSGKMFKTAVFEYGNDVVIDGKKSPFISKMVITDAVIKQNVTTMHFKKVYLKKIPNSMFNLNLLLK